MNICPQCGAAYADTGRFCPECGTPAPVAAPAPAAPVEAAPAQPVEAAPVMLVEAAPVMPVEAAPVQPEPVYQQPAYVQQPQYQQPPYPQGAYQQPPYQQGAYQQPPYQQGPYQQPPYQGYAPAPQKVKPPFNHDPENTGITKEDASSHKALAALGYLSSLWIVIGLLANPDSRYLKFHANQCAGLFVGWLVVSLCAVVPFLGWLASAVGSVVLTIFTIIGLISAAKGCAKSVPVVGKYHFIKY